MGEKELRRLRAEGVIEKVGPDAETARYQVKSNVTDDAQKRSRNSCDDVARSATVLAWRE